MDITVTESEVSLSVKGQGTMGVSYSDGVNTVVLARLRDGRLGQLCRYCNGDGMRTPPTRAAEKRFGSTPCNGGCQGTGIRRVYSDDQAGLEAAQRRLRHLRMTPAERERVYQAEQEVWYAEHGDLVAAATRYAPESRTLRDLLRHLRSGAMMTWTPAQVRAVHSILEKIENPPPSRHVGQPGEQITFTGVIEQTSINKKQFGAQMFSVIVYGDGDFTEAILVLRGSAIAIRDLVGMEGMWMRATARVSHHSRHQGRDETWLGAPRVLETSDTRGADRSGWPGTMTFTGRDGLHTTMKIRDGEHAHTLLPVVFSGLRYGLPQHVQLTWAGSDEVTLFEAADTLTNDPAGPYAALLELDEPPQLPPAPVVAGSRRCAVNGCTRDKECAGLCDMHYRRRRRGMPNWDEPAPLRAIPKDGCCGHGHLRTPANTAITPAGTQRCRECEAEASRLARAKTREADLQALRRWLSQAA